MAERIGDVKSGEIGNPGNQETSVEYTPGDSRRETRNMSTFPVRTSSRNEDTAAKQKEMINRRPTGMQVEEPNESESSGSSGTDLEIHNQGDAHIVRMVSEEQHAISFHQVNISEGSSGIHVGNINYYEGSPEQLKWNVNDKEVKPSEILAESRDELKVVFTGTGWEKLWNTPG